MPRAGQGQTEQVTFTPADSTDFNSVQTSVPVNVITTKTTPQVSVNPVNITYGTPFANSQLSGSATAVVSGKSTSVPGSFAYSSVAGLVYGAGTSQVGVIFTPNDTTDFQTVQLEVTATIGRATPQVSVNPVSITYGTALANTQLQGKGTATAVVNGQTVTVAGTFSYTIAAGTVLNAGTQSIAVSFTPNDTTDFTSTATSVHVVVKAATPKISTPTSSANSAFFNSTVTFTVTVQAPSGGTPGEAAGFSTKTARYPWAQWLLETVNGQQQAACD